MKHFLREEESPRQDDNFEEFCDNFAPGGSNTVTINISEPVKIYESSLIEYSQARRFASEFMGIRSAYRTSAVESRDAVINYLLRYEDITEKELLNRKTGKVSIADLTRKRLIANNKASVFLKLYDEFSKKKTEVNSLNGINEKLDTSEDIISDYGNKLGKLKYHINPINNRRVSTINYAVINIKKEKLYMMEAPKGISFFVADLPQADLRIAVEIVLSSPIIKEIFAGDKDAYLGFAKAVYHMMKIDLDLAWFQEYRKDLKAVTLGPIYGKTEFEGDIQENHVKNINKLLAKDTKYCKFKANIKAKSDRGLPVISTSYFGYSREVTKEGEKSVVNAALNSPIQTGTAELVILITNSICRDLREAGLKQGEDFGVLVVRYDEPIFWLKDEYIQDYGWIFGNHESVQIDGFNPIPLDFEVTKKYTIKDKELTERYRKSCRDNKDRINTKLKEYEDTVDSYMPVLGIIELCYGYTETDFGYITALYEEATKSVKYSIFKNPPNGKLTPEQVFSKTCNMIGNSRKTLREEGFVDTVILNNNIITGSQSYGNELVIMSEPISKDMEYKTNHIAYIASYLYAKKNNLDLSKFPESKLEQMSTFVSPTNTIKNMIPWFK